MPYVELDQIYSYFIELRNKLCVEMHFWQISYMYENLVFTLKLPFYVQSKMVWVLILFTNSLESKKNDNIYK